MPHGKIIKWNVFYMEILVTQPTPTPISVFFIIYQYHQFSLLIASPVHSSFTQNRSSGDAFQDNMKETYQLSLESQEYNDNMISIVAFLFIHHLSFHLFIHSFLNNHQVSIASRSSQISRNRCDDFITYSDYCQFRVMQKVLSKHLKISNFA